MNLERLYRKLPNFLKYNNFLLKKVLSLAKKIRKVNSNEMDFHYFLLNFLFTNYDIKPRGTLRKLQLLSLELLKFADNVCNKYNLSLWLDSGTLLGAVRHSGFIPWDDDVDVGMLREDYDKFIEIFPKELEKYPILKDKIGLTKLIENEENYFSGFKSVYDVGDKSNILSEEKFLFLQFAWLKPYVKIDFFPRDYLIEEKKELLEKEYPVAKYKLSKETRNGNLNFDESFNSENKRLGITKDKTSLICDGLDYLEMTPLRIFDYDDIFPFKTMEFEDTFFKVPNKPESLLAKWYGSNFMSIPHYLDTHDLTKFIESQFDSKEEMDKAFEESLEILREINENYQ
ncbi:MAG: LicD family protein [Methanobrevibacter sp.]|uniref:LicD family protein n=1 Tax=Methanobrevibacter sp. TaxID=66852 RepID=UPI0026DEF540|nr:LicD family protein [Methanobrevibacter sp.]MDO5849535.1 LicD family protein [Methanobrevibacter sp.]